MKIVFARKTILFILFCSLGLCALCSAVTSTISRHKSASDFIKGETDETVISSEGVVTLARKGKQIDLGDLLDNVWMINTIVGDGKGAIYLGTSPNGEIIKYSGGEGRRIYPCCDERQEAKAEEGSEAEEPFVNEHIFAMAIDSRGNLLAGVSGDNCRLLRFKGGDVETIFAAEEVKYIFAIALDRAGNIYLATGPNGLVYRLDASGRKARVIYDARDNNILSLAVGKDGAVYAGCDQRGLVYKINQRAKSATVLYDAEQDEITALLLDDEGNLYAAATSAQAVKEHIKGTSVSSDSGAGRPDLKTKPKEGEGKDNSTTLEIPNTGDAVSDKPGAAPAAAAKGELPKSAGRIYKITGEGFVTSVFSEMAVFYALARKDSQLLLATGNNAQLFAVDPDTEEKMVAYEDEQSSQMTALAVGCDHVFLGCANPAKLIRLEDAYVATGTYTSPLIDAGQPAMWGKLQINAEVPEGCVILMSAHSGNVNDPNDATFSSWTKPVKVTRATQLKCPVGRFCQYELTLKTDEEDETPAVREVAVAHVIPNLAPQVTSVKTLRSGDKNKKGAFQLSWTATDRNKDMLIYRIEFRRVGRKTWIELKDKLAATKYEWNTNTVEDGRYEIRITADDVRSNTSTTAMTGSRISDPLVVDNTAPRIEKAQVRVKGTTATIKLTVKDEYTVIGRVSYTVDSNEDWMATLPNDSVYDTTREDFAIVIEDLEPGEHVVALKVADHVGNVTYKTFEIEVK